MAAVTRRVLEEGIASFAEDFAALLETIEGKIARVRDGQVAASRAARARSRLPVGARLDDDRARPRGRADLAQGPHRLEGRPDRDRGSARLAHGHRPDARALPGARGVREAGARPTASRPRCSWGWAARRSRPRSFMSTFGAAEGALELIVLDTTHPATIRRVTDELELGAHAVRRREQVRARRPRRSRTSRTSGSWCPRRRVRRDHRSGNAARRDRSRARVPRGVREPGRHRRPLLRALLLRARSRRARSVRRCMRCSIVRRRWRARPTGRSPAAQVPAVLLGAAIGEGALAGRDKLTIVAAARARVVRRLGRTADRRVDRQGGRGHRARRRRAARRRQTSTATTASSSSSASTTSVDALEAAGHPILRIELDDREQLGGEFFRWEFATAIAGTCSGSTRSTSPTSSRPRTRRRRSSRRAGSSVGVRRPRCDARGSSSRATTSRSRRTSTGRTRPRTRSSGLAIALRDRYRVATTRRVRSAVPAFHRPAPQGRAEHAGSSSRSSTTAATSDVPIPGQAYTFGTLIDAQALGDLRALRAGGRRVARVTARDADGR